MDMTSRKFISRLPNYSVASILFRLLFVSLIAVFSVSLIWHSVNKGVGRPEWTLYLIAIVGFNVLSEINIVLDNILERFLPILQYIGARLRVQLFLTLGLVVLVHQVIIRIMNYEVGAQIGLVYISVATGLVFVTLMSSSLLITRLMEKWYHVQKQVEEMKQEKLQMDYNVLQDQLNPHFLFNNLSVLKSLIIYDKEKAVNFTQNFTDVYRYVLKSRMLKTVALTDELEFIQAYIRLHQERLGAGLKIDVNIDTAMLQRRVAPLALQLLVENAIKHNIVTRTLPLKIEILTIGDTLIVKNNIQLKEGSYSTQTGLKNLQKRYQVLAGKLPEVKKSETSFEVRIPLLAETDVELK